MLNQLAKSICLLLLCVVVLLVSGCHSPFVPSHRIARWDTHMFSGEAICEHKDQRHRTETFVVEFNMSGELHDGTLWMTFMLQETVPDRYGSPPSSAGKEYIRSCEMTVLAPPSASSVDYDPEVWVLNSRFASSNHVAKSIEELRTKMKEHGYLPMIGEISLSYGSPPKIELTIDAESATEEFKLSLDGTLTTQSHFGRIKTTPHYKVGANVEYYAWTSKNWQD